jgi:hypothetical protein
MVLKIHNGTDKPVYTVVYGKDLKGNWSFYKNGILNPAQVGEDTRQYLYTISKKSEISLAYFPLISNGVVLFFTDLEKHLWVAGQEEVAIASIGAKASIDFSFDGEVKFINALGVDVNLKEEQLSVSFKG